MPRARALSISSGLCFRSYIRSRARLYTHFPLSSFSALSSPRNFTFLPRPFSYMRRPFLTVRAVRYDRKSSVSFFVRIMCIYTFCCIPPCEESKVPTYTDGLQNKSYMPESFCARDLQIKVRARDGEKERN